MQNGWYQWQETTLFIALKITPKSKKDAVLGLYGTSLKIALQAPPEKGKANQALISFLAQQLYIQKHQMTLLKGDTASKKIIKIERLDFTRWHAFLETVTG